MPDVDRAIDESLQQRVGRVFITAQRDQVAVPDARKVVIRKAGPEDRVREDRPGAVEVLGAALERAVDFFGWGGRTAWTECHSVRSLPGCPTEQQSRNQTIGPFARRKEIKVW